MNLIIARKKTSEAEIPAREASSVNKVTELSAPSAAPQLSTPKPMPDETAIRMRAYEIYANRGYQDGNQEADWLEAENQLRNGN